MTLNDDVLGREAERIHARVDSAPVEEWLKREARIELDRIAKLADDRIAVARTFRAEEKETITQAEPDKNYQRMRIFEVVAQHMQPNVTYLREIERWVDGQS